MKPAREQTILAVDGGNSKADVALVAGDGRMVAALRGPTVSHQALGFDAAREGLAQLVGQAWAAAGTRPAGARVAEIGVFCLAGADTPPDVRRLEQTVAALELAHHDVVLNDAFAILRAGTARPWGVSVIAGAGVNAAGVAPDGRMARLDALGDISGDWGGGLSIGWAGVAAAVRGRDGRGPRTVLERTVPGHFGLRGPAALTSALYRGRIREARIRELSPVVFAGAVDGDAVARGIVDRMADEVVTMATALIRRLRMTALDVEVVLGGGVFRADDPAFYARIDSGIRLVAPSARIVRLTAQPVLGAALLGLDRLEGLSERERHEAEERLRTALEAWRPD
ncbi:MAG: N-acetylglucosamine kinase [Chloroflexota bacterium]